MSLQFQLQQFFVFQISFVNKFATTEGGTHVDYVANQIVAGVVRICREHFQVQESEVKRQLWVFVNAVIDNPSFDSPTRGALTTPQESFGSSCELSRQFLIHGM
jgi:DNA topoisomerase-2